MDAETLMLLKSIQSRLDEVHREGGERGRRMWGEINEQKVTLVSINHRLGMVESAVAGAKPTLEDYKLQRDRVAAAGWLGKKLWWFGTLVIGAVGGIYAIKDYIIHWLMSK